MSGIPLAREASRSEFTLRMVYGPSSMAAARGPLFMTHPSALPLLPRMVSNPLCTSPILKNSLGLEQIGCHNVLFVAAR